MVPGGVRKGRDVLAGDDEEVHRRLRMDVSKGVALRILVDGLRRDLTCDDLAEEAIHGDEIHRDQCTGGGFPIEDNFDVQGRHPST